MDTGGNNHLWGILPNVEWDLIKWVLRQIAWATVITVVVAVARKIKEKISDWWVLGTVFVLSLLVLYLTSEGSQSTTAPVIVSSPNQKVSTRGDTWATPCQLRMTRDESEKIVNFLRDYSSQRQRVTKIEIVVEKERLNDCLYAQDLRHVFRLSHWGPVRIVVGKPPPLGKAVWFETSVNDGLARTFWEQTLCYLSQDFYHESQESFASNTWMLYVGDKEGPGGYSHEVICPNKRPGHESLPRTP